MLTSAVVGWEQSYGTCPLRSWRGCNCLRRPCVQCRDERKNAYYLQDQSDNEDQDRATRGGRVQHGAKCRQLVHFFNPPERVGSRQVIGHRAVVTYVGRLSLHLAPVCY
ncbi:uncharacterized protein LOC123014828 [Tribolium madens]|uniref:uncharacterized protein LOC123014828 n=1 Tax=Tribolium madens TaxID=41895 RepID=UPI001CF723BA|nr:uncharacterized protein LOC123014828 [Tribolium madens]